MLPEVLSPLFQKLEQKPYQKVDETQIYLELNKFIESNDIPVTKEIEAELIAFAFIEDLSINTRNKGGYYKSALSRRDKAEIAFPDVQAINVDTLMYINARIKSSKHPVLKARYSGIVLDFSKIVLKSPPSWDVAKIHVDALIESVLEEFFESYHICKGKLRRALKLAISYKLDHSTSRIKDYLITKDSDVGLNEEKNIFTSSFDLLISQKKPLLTSDEENEVVELLEKRLVALATLNLQACKAVSDRLAGYYHKKGLTEKVREVLNGLTRSYDIHLENKPAVQSTSYLEELLLRYKQFHLHEEANKLMIRIREVSRNSDRDLKKIIASHEINKNDLVAYANKILKYDDPDVTFARIIKSQMALIEDLDQDLENQFQDGRLSMFIHQGFIDKKGRKLATIGPYPEDKVGHRINHYHRLLTVNGIGLHFIFTEGAKQNKLTEDSIMDFLKRSCIISADRLQILEAGIRFYFEEKYAASIHLLIPQFEEALRNLVEINGGNILTMKEDVFHLKTFDHLLHDEILKKAFGEDIAFYFRVLFTDPRGWNLRNQVAHGLIDPKLLNQNTAQRVLHALFCLGMIRWQQVV